MPAELMTDATAQPCTPPTPAPARAPLRVVQTTLEAMLARYAEADGISPRDDYDPVPRAHPMAEAKFLEACTDLHTSGLLGVAAYRARVAQSLRRLDELAVRPTAEACAWGLGFSFRDAPVDEPYVVTTGLVVRALAHARPLLAAADASRLDALLSPAVEWLTSGVERLPHAGSALPTYSPHIKVPAYNVAAVWAGALATAGDRSAEVEAVAQTVLTAGGDGLGWRYAPESTRVDLVHNSYIVQGLLDVLGPEGDHVGAGLSGLLQFSGDPWLDAYDLRQLSDVEPSDLVRTPVVRTAGDRVLVGQDRAARAWSVGEATAALARLGAGGHGSSVALAAAHRLAAHALATSAMDDRFRHLTHVAHGLAALLRTVRKAREDAS